MNPKKKTLFHKVADDYESSGFLVFKGNQKKIIIF